MKRLLLLPLLLGLSSPVRAEVDPKVREACLPAADFLGCVKAYSGEAIKESTTNSNERIANSCPPSFAYVGAGQCRQFYCIDFGKEVPILYRKHVCEKKPISLGFERWRLRWVLAGKTASAIHSPFCPNREPGLGWGSTCDEDKGLLPEKVSTKNKLPMACRNGVWDKDHPKCQVKVDKIPSSMDMD